MDGGVIFAILVTIAAMAVVSWIFNPRRARVKLSEIEAIDERRFKVKGEVYEATKWVTEDLLEMLKNSSERLNFLKSLPEAILEVDEKLKKELEKNPMNHEIILVLDKRFPPSKNLIDPNLDSISNAVRCLCGFPEELAGDIRAERIIAGWEPV